MLPKDFRGYLDYLESKGLLLRVKKAVSPKHEIAAGIRKIADNDGPALFFENIKGFPGWQVAGGLYATRRLMAAALETEPAEDKLLKRYLEVDQKRVKPKIVATGPVKEIIIKGDDVDLNQLPVPVYCELDSGPYIIGAPDIGRHPVTGIQNLSCHRREVKSKNTTAISALPHQHLGLIIQAGDETGKGAEIATVLGGPPEMNIAGQMHPPMGVDEVEIAGALRGEPIELVKCETIDVMVPANAEVIIEGYSVPGGRTTDGPFGEYPGDYIVSGQAVVRERPLLKVTAITMRKNPIFQAIATGFPMIEDQWMQKWALAATAWRELENVVPFPDDIKGINYTEGSATLICIVSIHKRNEKAPLDIIYHMLSSNYHMKAVIVVDDDVDPYDAREVERIIATRTLPQNIIIPQARSQVYGHFATRFGIDATVPIKDKKWYVRAYPPGVDKVDYV